MPMLRACPAGLCDDATCRGVVRARQCRRVERTPLSRRRRGWRRGWRRGMTLVEVILAIMILSGTMLGLGNFARKFQSANSGSTTKTLASDLATQRIEEVRAYRPYGSIVSAYGSTSETFTSGLYTGFTRTTTSARCSGCTSATTNDYVTVTVSVTGNNLVTAIRKTAIIAAY